MRVTIGEPGTEAKHEGALSWAPAALLGLVALGMAASAQAGAGDATTAAGVFPPWWSPAQSLDAASRAGAIVGVGAAPFVIIVRAPQGAAAPRLQAQGALVALDAGLARLCGA